MERKILILSSSDEAIENISVSASEYGFDKISYSDGSNARKLVTDNAYDLVFINVPLSNEYGLELASFIYQNTDSAMIISVSQKSSSMVAEKIGFTGAYVLPRPVNKALLIQAMRFVMHTRETIKTLHDEKSSLETKIKDIKLIDRAKWTLVQYLRISEDEAHKQILKRAMDANVHPRSIAQDILRTYEI